MCVIFSGVLSKMYSSRVTKPKEVKVRIFPYGVNLPVDIPLMLEHIRQWKGFLNSEQALIYCIREVYKNVPQDK